VVPPIPALPLVAVTIIVVTIAATMTGGPNVNG